MGETISNTDDIIDVRDVIARIEELRDYLNVIRDEQGFMVDFNDWLENVTTNSRPLVAAIGSGAHDVIADCEELIRLEKLLDECKGNGGDEQWKGDWYPVTLIHDTYFVGAMREFCKDIDFPNGVPSYYVIDWDETAENLRADYTSIDFDGETYWTR